MNHITKLINDGHKFARDTTISLPVARDCGYYAGILYAYLQDEMRECENYNDRCNTRLGIKWIPGLPLVHILQDLPVFPDTGSIKRAAVELIKAGVILAETTGKFLEERLKTSRKRDIRTWWHVSQHYLAVPSDYYDMSKRRVFSALEAPAYGIPQALILAHWRHSPVVETEGKWIFKRLSAVELVEVLPMDERTARRHLKALLADRVIVQHPTKPKLYRLAVAPAPQPVRLVPKKAAESAADKGAKAACAAAPACPKDAQKPA